MRARSLLFDCSADPFPAPFPFFFSRSHSSSHTGPSADQLGDRDGGKVETGGADYRRTEDLAPTGLQPVPEQRYTWAHSAFAGSLIHMLNGCR